MRISKDFVSPDASPQVSNYIARTAEFPITRSELHAGSFTDIPAEQGSNVDFRKT